MAENVREIRCPKCGNEGFVYLRATRMKCSSCYNHFVFKMGEDPVEPLVEMSCGRCGVIFFANQNMRSAVCFSCDALLKLCTRSGELKPESDSVDHPAHYTAYKGLEIIDLTEQMTFNRGNVVKYVTRAGLKPDGDELEDLRKAAWYLNREIQNLEKGKEEKK